MRNTDYLPSTDSELLVWFHNFQLKFGGYAPTLGFTAADVTGVTDDYNMLAFVIQAAEVIRNESQARTTYKTVLRDGPLRAVPPALPTLPALPVPGTIVGPGIVPRMRAMVQRIRAQPSYTESMANDLGIIGTPAVTPSKPLATAKAEPGFTVTIDWLKAGFDGVLVESRRSGETVWTSLATDLQSPYVDDREPLQPAVAEERLYRLRYLKGDEPIGDYSDTMTVTTTR